ncbi:FAD-dependent oxidoreductase [Geosporobacter ferrireducens]|uniref:Dehydrogenase n=1 Tax=Geosporobacter ferrireducens TaxID=1424294 RepID=A0A1D8GH72_9FIRM|nr:FAD-dependent oxidoreductase [Geosporobacter ferrireducens]AOT70264.1 dehydrogenase [Geosporobacter ferrireducens]
MKERILVIGAVAAGTKAAAKMKRENSEADVVIVTKDQDISYAGCGLPYFIGSLIEDRKELVVKTPGDFKAVTGVDVWIMHEATKINPQEKTANIKSLITEEEKLFYYDKLVIATGASPFVPPIQGKDLEGVYTLRTIADAVSIRESVDQGSVKKAVIVGGGFIGLEVAENLRERDIEVSVVELAPHILPPFDEEMALYAQNYMQEMGVNIFTEEKVTALEDCKGKVCRVITDQREIEADLVVLSVGVRPNVSLAREAGIEVGSTGAIKVDKSMKTSVPDIYAIGDCAETLHLVTGRPAWIPMGSTANKMGRVAAVNLMDTGKEILPGVLGTTIVKLFKLNAGKTGLSERDAKKAGYPVITAIVPANDRAHYYPGYREIITKLIVDQETHKILGAQVIGEGVVDKPIDILATAISFGAKVEDIEKLDLAYAPPFSMAMASTIVAANVVVNKLKGKLESISPIELKNRLESVQVVDTRDEGSYTIGTIPGAINIPGGELKFRARELNPDKEIVLVCKIGKNAYLSYLTLKGLGFKKVKILDGGVRVYPFELE